MCNNLCHPNKCKVCGCKMEEDYNLFWNEVCTDKYNLNMYKACEYFDGKKSGLYPCITPLNMEDKHYKYYIDVIKKNNKKL